MNDLIDKNYQSMVAKYLENYVSKKNTTLMNISKQTSISHTQISRIVRRTSDNFTLKSLIAIANIEFDSLGDFFLHLEENYDPKKGTNNRDLSLDKLLSNCSPTLLRSVVSKLNISHKKEQKIIKNRAEWLFNLGDLMLDGSLDQLLDFEALIINYYRSHIRLDSKEVNQRLDEILKTSVNLHSKK